MAGRNSSFLIRHFILMPVPEALNSVAVADGLRDMQGLAARFFGGRSAAEPGVARTKADGSFHQPTAPKEHCFIKNERLFSFLKSTPNLNPDKPPFVIFNS